MPQLDDWSTAIFAHNEAANIVGCLDAVREQRKNLPFPIFVLINGCRDRTEQRVRDYARTHANVRPVTIGIGDKANAWNEYVHRAADPADVHFFVDGDTRPQLGSFAALACAMRDAPIARAVGALPTTGRDRHGWSQRMVAFGRLAGCLYALRGTWLAQLRHDAVRIPVGLIGEDLFLSCIVKERFDAHALMSPSPYLAFAADAGFAFRSLSRLRPKDWATYAGRLLRYRVRDYQLGLLLRLMHSGASARIPPDVRSVYRESDVLPRYRWCGRTTPIDLLAVRRIRRAARDDAGANSETTS